MTSILTLSKNDPHVFCRTWHGLSNVVYRFSMRRVVLEISRGVEINPPAGSRLAQTPADARVNLENVENQNVNRCPFYVDCAVFVSQFRGFRLQCTAHVSFRTSM